MDKRKNRGKFQSTLRRTERPRRALKQNRRISFQSTLRRTERHTHCMDMLCKLRFQSTLRRTERLKDAVSAGALSNISIHAPTNGATLKIGFVDRRQVDFNPRSDERSDVVVCVVSSVCVISIHAPTNGATTCGRWNDIVYKHFNPRSDERSDDY